MTGTRSAPPRSGMDDTEGSPEADPREEGSDGDGRPRGKPGDSAVRTVELYVRSLAKTGPHDATHDALERIRRLEGRGVVDDHAVTTVGGKLCRCEACVATGHVGDLLAELGEWRAWADSRNVAVPLEEYRLDSAITGEAYRFVSPPAVTLVSRLDGEIEGVYPHRRDGTVVTPRAYLREALAGAVPPSVP